MEIERKFLVRELPNNLEQYEHYEIEQAYLCTSPTLRIRRMGDEYILTIKERVALSSSSAIHNREEEFALSKESYQRLLSKCDSSGVGKTRYIIDLWKLMKDDAYTGLVAELDIFHGRHNGLMLVEVEFPNTQAANAFVPPEWFGEDVSSEPCYRNSFLASMP
ncbi:MAG: CYTH domain-containing protein [Bacteroidales bacterium]|nr:CYTH domain-containing protein [Bacteroidales bacterium]